jgi:hypothetical protein
MLAFLDIGHNLGSGPSKEYHIKSLIKFDPVVLEKIKM